MMKISLVFADPQHPQWFEVDVIDDCTLAQAIEQSNILQRCPSIDLSTHRTGIFGKLVKQDYPLKPGDRIEIYLPVTIDPKTIKRRGRP